MTAKKQTILKSKFDIAESEINNKGKENTVRLTFDLDKELYKRLKIKSAETGSTMRALVEQQIRELVG